VSQPFRQLTEFKRRADSQLRHDLRTLRLDGAFRNSKCFGNLLIEIAGNDAIKYLALAGRY
jgi:hypothetical protein